MIQIQVPQGKTWTTVAHREGSEMDFPEPVRASDIGARPGEVCRLALTHGTQIIRKRLLRVES